MNIAISNLKIMQNLTIIRHPCWSLQGLSNAVENCGQLSSTVDTSSGSLNLRIFSPKEGFRLGSNRIPGAFQPFPSLPHPIHARKDWR
jgi:hypothetical protein